MAEQQQNDDEKGGEKKAESKPKLAINTTNLLLLIVLAVLLLLIVGGSIAAVMIYRNGAHSAAPAQQAGDPAAAAADAKDEKAKEAAQKAKDAKEKKEKDAGPKAPAIYVTLEPPFVVNFQAGKPAKFLQITMEIMTRDQNTAQVLKDNNPLLRNDLLMLYGAQEYETVASPDGREALRQHALETVRGVVKKEGGKPSEVEAVYFTSLVMQ